MNDIRFAIRQLLKNPGFTAVAVVTLALGIGANTAIFSIIHGVLLRPLPFLQPERLVTLWESHPAKGIDQQKTSPITFRDWSQENHCFERLGFYTGPMDLNLVTAEGSEKVRASFPSANLFQLLGIEPQIGRTFGSEDDRPEGPQTVMISHRYWQDRFSGDPGTIGRTLTLDSFGRRTYTIVGVMPPGFTFPEATDLWLAAGWNGIPQDRRSGHWIDVIARLKPDTTLSQARSEMTGIQSRLAEAHPEARVGPQVSIVPLLQQTVGRSTSKALLVLWGAVAAVLLIACVNVANLMLARGTSRQKEIALRFALGAGRGRIFRQLLTESILLSILGAALGILLGVFALKIFLATNPVHIPRLGDVSIDARVLGVTLIVAVLTGLLFGLAPSWRFSHPDVSESLKGSSRGGGNGVSERHMQNGLVVAEVALATVLLTGAGLMLQSFAKLLSTDRGIQPQQVVVADLDFSVSGYTTWVQSTATRPQILLQQVLERVRQLPGVQHAGVAYRFLRHDNRPPSDWPFSIFGRPIPPENQRPTADQNAVSPGFFRALGIPLLRGRDFSENDSLKSPGVAIVNESFVRRFFPHQDPLGQHITLVSQPGALDATDRYGIPIWQEIIGVVGDVKSLSTQPEAVPEVYRSYWQWPMQSPKIFVQGTGSLSTLGAAIQKETKALAPNLPVPIVRSLSGRIDESIAEPKFQAALLSLFAAVALFLAGCGIYGVLAYNVARRQREIGVRIALGAQKRNVLLLILGQGLRLALIGVAFGTAAALALTRIIQSMLYEVTPTDPTTFAGVVLLLIGIALLACWLPASRAAKTDPMEALRAE